MADQIRVGTIFIEEGTTLPDSLKFESEPYSTNGWRSVKNLNGYEFDRRLRAVGWNLFHLAQIKASVFGFDREKAARRALNRVLANVKSDNFNSLEISQVAAKRFLGLPLCDCLCPCAAYSGKYVFVARQAACETEPSQIGLQPS
jgi:hypothetical protein